jgi:hypothetical protein
MPDSSGASCMVAEGAGESGVSAEDVLGVGRLEAGSTISIIKLERVRRVEGPGTSFGPSVVLFSVLLVAGLLGTPGAWTLDRVVRAGATRLRLERGGIMQGLCINI